jgi:hypothetical protein
MAKKVLGRELREFNEKTKIASNALRRCVREDWLQGCEIARQNHVTAGETLLNIYSLMKREVKK